MSITGFLSDFSLPEIFWLIGQGRKTGRLMICALPQVPDMPAMRYYIWVERGCIVAAANRLDEQGLISLITQQQYLSNRVIAKLIQWCCPIDQPLGLCFKNHGVLQNEQLQELFIIQLSQQLSSLFQLKEGHFEFEQNVAMSIREMTGFNLPLATLCYYSKNDGLRLIELTKANAIQDKKRGLPREINQNKSVV